MNYRAVACTLSSVDNILSISSGPALLTNSALLAVWSRQNISMWCTVCVGHPQPQFGSILGTFINVSHPFSPSTLVLSRNNTDTWCFGVSKYSFRGLYIQGFF